MWPCPWTCTSLSSLVVHLASAQAQLAVPINRYQATDNSPITAACAGSVLRAGCLSGGSNAHGSWFALKITSFFFLHGTFHCKCIIFFLFVLIWYWQPTDQNSGHFGPTQLYRQPRAGSTLLHQIIYKMWGWLYKPHSEKARWLSCIIQSPVCVAWVAPPGQQHKGQVLPLRFLFVEVCHYTSDRNWKSILDCITSST